MITGEEIRTPSESKRSIFPTRQVLAYLLVIGTLLLLPEVGWTTDEANRDLATTTQVSQTPTSQSVPGAELRDNKKGDLTVSVQSLEDVMKVLTSSVPNRLEANVQPVTAAQAEKYGFRSNQGVVIIWLDPKGPLGRAGLATSDIILQIDNQPIESLENFISLIDSLGRLQPATFSILDHRTGRIRNVRIVVRTEQPVQEARGNFLTRHVGAAVAGIQKTAQSIQQQASYAAEMGKEAIATAISGLKKWAGMAEKAPVASFKREREVPAKPPRPAEREAGGPG